MTRISAAVSVAVVSLAVLLGGCTAPPPPLPAANSTSGPEIDQTPSDVFALSVGDCLNETAAADTSEVPIVDCSDQHDFEVYAEFEMRGGDFPGTPVLEAEAAETCSDEFGAFAGIAYEDSVLGITHYTPTEQSWVQNDDRLVTCLIGNPAGKTTGSLADARI